MQTANWSGAKTFLGNRVKKCAEVDILRECSKACCKCVNHWNVAPPLAAPLQVAQHQAQMAKESRQQSPEKLSDFLKGNHSAVHVHASTESVVDIEVLLDPLSSTAQKMAPLLLLLAERLDARITVYLNPQREHGDLPLKNYYR